MNKRFFDTETTPTQKTFWRFYNIRLILGVFAIVIFLLFARTFKFGLLIFLLFFFIGTILLLIYGIIIIKHKSFYLFWFSKTINGKFAVLIGIFAIFSSIIVMILLFLVFYYNYLR